jgi:hypothetical protein
MKPLFLRSLSFTWESMSLSKLLAFHPTPFRFSLLMCIVVPLFPNDSEQMNTLRTNFEKAGQFFEADQAKQRVTKLKDALSKKKLLNLSERHRGEVAPPSKGI